MRPATPADWPVIFQVEAAAFAREDEARIVDRVRADGEAVVELVAEDEAGEIVGHVLFSRMTVTPPGKRLAGLAPVAVRPDRQNRKLGDALCRAGIAELRTLGYDAVVVLGHPDYYPRFGFSAEAAKAIASPYAGNPAFMALELQPGALAAQLRAEYPSAF